jgi:hypothetical protein
MKSSVSYVIFVIILIGISIFVITILTWNWISSQKRESGEYECKVKQFNYCLALINKQNPNWDEMQPKDCSRYGITKPTEDECKGLLS